MESLGSITEAVYYGFFLLHESLRVEIFHREGAGFEAIFAYVYLPGGGYGAVWVEDIDGFEAVLLPNHIVVYGMGRGDFEYSSAERHVYRLVCDYGDFPVHKRDYHVLTVEMGVTGIVRIHTHGHIAHYGFRAGSGNE